MIDVKNLCFSYGKDRLIDNLSLILRDGELTALVGLNGAGKSTLMRLLCGEAGAAHGEITVDGSSLSSLSARERAKHISYFPQGRPTPDLSALELVSLGRHPYVGARLRTPPEALRIAEEKLKAVSATELKHRNVRTLSFGERQRVYLAMLLAQETKNCLLDEPFGFMDAAVTFSSLELLRSLARGGACVTCILHSLPEALSFADRIILLEKGKIALDGTPQELFEGGALAEAFGVKIHKCEADGRVAYGILP